MRVAVVGAGGVGGGFGAALARAGADVTFIARGAHLAAMRSHGLKVESPRGDAHLVPTQATDDPATVGPVDVVLFCVKLWDVESAGAHVKPMIGSTTAVIPLQNGIDAPERLVPILGAPAVMGGVAQISASIVAPGVIRQVGTFMRMAFGELDGKRSRRGEELLALCLKAGFEAALSEQILAALEWQRRQDNWLREAGRFVPNPATWLNQGRWQDEPTTTPRFNERTLALGKATQEFLKS